MADAPRRLRSYCNTYQIIRTPRSQTRRSPITSPSDPSDILLIGTQTRAPLFLEAMKRRHEGGSGDAAPPSAHPKPLGFHTTPGAAARSLTSCALLPRGVQMPWVGFGTYRLGASSAKAATLLALRAGYRLIDTAYIYAGEKCEPEVGKAIKAAIDGGVLASREELFVVTKHWRKHHGYDETLACLGRSLARLQVEYVDLWLMHWPGPAWSTMNRRNDELAAHGPWHYAVAGHGRDEIAALRAETWRAMEDALDKGQCRAIGVSNFTVAHLESLKRTARVWPPAVNQGGQTEVRALFVRVDS